MEATALNSISTSEIQKRIQTDLCLLALQLMGKEKKSAATGKITERAKAWQK